MMISVLLGLVGMLSLAAPRGSNVSSFVFVPSKTNTAGRRTVEINSSVQRTKSKLSEKTESTIATTDDDSLLWKTLANRFQGDFDNYAQVVQDRERGMLPKEGGGHEHIHCTLLPLSEDSRLAAFYFDGQPQAIFRFRYYKMVNRPEMDAVDTILYTLDPILEKKLRECKDPLEWPLIFAHFSKDQEHPVVHLLEKCDVRWSFTRDPKLHSYVTDSKTEDKKGIHAVMVHGQALVQSQMMLPERQTILIKDQLSLYENEFYIHDRGFNPDTMEYIYGNQREVPYRLERVTTGLNRRIVNPELKWTLGTNYRTPEEYQTRMEVIGYSIPQR